MGRPSRQIGNVDERLRKLERKQKNHEDLDDDRFMKIKKKKKKENPIKDRLIYRV